MYLTLLDVSVRLRTLRDALMSSHVFDFQVMLRHAFVSNHVFGFQVMLRHAFVSNHVFGLSVICTRLCYDASNNSSTVARVFVRTVTFLPSRYLATIATYRYTD
jgi:hypothetical protein